MAVDTDLIQENIEEYLDQHERKELLRFVTIGSVDDGKSTLIGRLLFDTGSVYQDIIDSIKKIDEDGNEVVDLANITDGLLAEREQGITIDVAYRYFTTPKRKFIIADTPGMKVFYASYKNQKLSIYRELLNSEDFDIIYINGIYSIKYSILPLLVSKKFQGKVIVAPRGMLAKSAIHVKGYKRNYS